MQKLVVFDLGGVLLRVARTWSEAADRAEVSYARNGEAALNDFPGIVEHQADRIGLEPYLVQLQDFMGLVDRQDAYDVHMGILMEAMPGTDDLVRDLRTRGFRTACLSNTNGVHWDRLSSKDWYPHIASLDLLCASHILRLEKPDPKIFREFERIAKSSPGQITFFDDSEVNVKAAREAGWTAHWINPLKDTASQMRDHLTGVTARR